MAVQIRNMNASIQRQPASSAPAPSAPAEGVGQMSDRALRERLRPIVMDILRQELDELRRRRG